MYTSISSVLKIVTELSFHIYFLCQQFVEYLEESQLMIEVWGSQKDQPTQTKGGTAAKKSTKELMAAEKAKEKVGNYIFVVLHLLCIGKPT